MPDTAHTFMALLLKLLGISAQCSALNCRGMTQETQIERIEVVHKTPVMFYRPNQPSGGHYLKVPAPQLSALQCCFHNLDTSASSLAIAQNGPLVLCTEWRLGMSRSFTYSARTSVLACPCEMVCKHQCVSIWLLISFQARHMCEQGCRCTDGVW